MDWKLALEIFCAVTGVAYALLEIVQWRAMWIVGIVTGAACAVVFGCEKLYASMGLNIYYVGISFYGLWQWRKDAEASSPEALHLRRPTGMVIGISAAVLVTGTAALWWILRLLGDPSSLLDAGVTVLSAIATWWLSRSLPQQWLLWVVADALTAWMCFRQGAFWMTGLYAAYAVAAIYGWFHWKRKGQYIR